MDSCLKTVNRSATSAFAPDGPYMAAGTMAGAVDSQFSSSANLDIFELDFASDDRELVLSGTAHSSERFNRISWGKYSADSTDYSLGLVAGGLVDGNIGLWNPKHLIHDENENAFIGNLSGHGGPVRGLEFNYLSPNYLASGADHGDVCVWDVTHPSNPVHLQPLKASGSAAQSEISYLSWNSKFQYILASTSFNGTTAIWDMRKQKPVISFSDSVRRRCSVLQWHPDVSTQLMVASDEDSSPSLRLWDLKNTISPVKEFVGHTKGVIAMSWCPFDSSYLLTCAKDNRTICWDTDSGEIVAELPPGTNWNFDVHWHYKNPGIISTSSYDGKIGIYNIEGCGRHGDDKDDVCAAPMRAPKWCKHRAGVSFGFGGKLLSFHSPDSSSGSSEVYVQDLVPEQGFVTRSPEFEAAIQNGDRAAFKLLCEKKSLESKTEEEKQTWSFMKTMFAEDGTARSNLLLHLGFNPPSQENDATEKEICAFPESDDTKSTSWNPVSALCADDGEDFFNNLPTPMEDTPVSTSNKEFLVDDSIEEHRQETTDTQGASSDPSFDDSVQHALVVGDYEGAVAQCISANRWADALILSHVCGASFWERTRDQYLKTSQSSYLKVVSAMVNNDLMSIAKTRPLRSWKETLALFCTYGQAEEWTLLCDTLAARLAAAGDTAAATLCYICSANIDRVVEIWAKDLSLVRDGTSHVERLQDLMEKTIVFALATGQKQFSASLYKLVEKYAEILTSQGLFLAAMDYLNLLRTEHLTTELVILRDHIALLTKPEITITENTGLQKGPTDNSSSGVNAPQHYHGEIAPPQVQPTVPSNPHRETYAQTINQSVAPPQVQPTVPSNPHTENYAHTINQSVAPPQVQPTVTSNPYRENYAHTINQSVAPQVQPTVPSNPYRENYAHTINQSVAPPQVQPTVPSNPYREDYAHTINQSVAPPNTQPPSCTPAPLGNITAGPVGHVPFVPGTSPWPRNMDQQHQQTSLGSQLYNGSCSVNVGNAPQVEQTPGQTITQFIPQQSAVSSANPAQLAPVQQLVAPAIPPPTVQTADTSNVPEHQKPVIATLTRLYNQNTEALGGPHSGKRREIEDNSKKLGALFTKLNTGEISGNASEKLVQLCQALDRGDIETAKNFEMLLRNSDWEECGFWLPTLKRMMSIRQNMR